MATDTAATAQEARIHEDSLIHYADYYEEDDDDDEEEEETSNRVSSSISASDTTSTNNLNHTTTTETTSTSTSRTKKMIYKAQMWLDGSSNLSRVTDCLTEDPSIQFLDIYMRESFLMLFSTEQVQRLMETIGRLPRLERLDISCPMREIIWNHGSDRPEPQDTAASTYLPIRALRAALTQPLTHLFLVNLKLSGSAEEFEDFGERIGQLSQLHFVVLAEIRLLDQRASESTTTATATSSSSSTCCSLLDPLLQSLAHLQNLSHVLVTGSHHLGALRPLTLQKLVSTSHSLRDLCLSQFQVADTHIAHMASGLAEAANNSTSSLRELDLECSLGVKGAQALADLLHVNSTLKELTIRLVKEEEEVENSTPMSTRLEEEVSERDSDTAAEQQGGSAGKPLSMMEEDNCDNNDRCPIQDEFCITKRQQSQEQQRNAILAQGIARSCLKNFELHNIDLRPRENSNSSVQEEQPFRQMLRDNYSLQSCKLSDGATYVLKGTIDFYIKLNELGRGKLFLLNQQQKEHDWITMLDKVKDNVSGLFYFLTINPSLCAAGQGATVTATAAPGGPTMCHRQFPNRKRKRLYRAVKYNGISYKK